MIFVKYCYLFYSCKLLEKWDKSNNDVKISMSNKLRKILMNQRNMITLLFVTMKHNYLDFVDLNIFLATKIRSDYKTIVQFLLTKDLVRLICNFRRIFAFRIRVQITFLNATLAVNWRNFLFPLPIEHNVFGVQFDCFCWITYLFTSIEWYII